MSYKVIHYFTDLQDKGHPYNVGDIFPRAGLSVSEERLKELSGSNNRQKKPLIELVEDKPAEEKKPITKTDINRMSKAELLQRAKNTGVDGAEDMTGAELKEYLIAVFGL